MKNIDFRITLYHTIILHLLPMNDDNISTNATIISFHELSTITAIILLYTNFLFIIFYITYILYIRRNYSDIIKVLSSLLPSLTTQKNILFLPPIFLFGMMKL